MKKSVLLISLILTFVNQGFSQLTNEVNKGYKYNNNFDLALATEGKQSLAALSWVHFNAVTKNKKFKVGYGVRFSSQVGKNLNYETAPAILTSKQRGPQVLFTEIFYENVDTLFVAKSQNNFLNLSINLQYTFKEKFDIGFNIDAAGFSFGKKTTGRYISSQSSQNGSTQTAAPTSLNLLLVSDNDIGALNSEFYFRYWFKPKWAIRAGASFAFTEYKTENKLRLDNDRWRNKSLMGMIAITFSPFR
ncbi:MAG: hypothetical protein H7321_09340 [Bacteroidia bacterium]|nr:hypothetical protein [Bacteroidia bacterium]